MFIEYEHHSHNDHSKVHYEHENAHSKLHSEAMQDLTHKEEKSEHHQPKDNHSERDLRRESEHSAFSQHGYWSKQQENYNRQGMMLVLNGDTLESIARKSLLLRGASIAGPDAIPDEADRIRALNMQHPNMAYLEHSRRLHPGMILDITEPRVGPDIHTSWQPWKDAPAGQITYVNRGERVVTQPGSQVIVEPGGAAMITSGATGFGYRGSHIESLPGSVSVSAGEVAAAGGAAVIKAEADTRVIELSPSQIKNPQIFPR